MADASAAANSAAAPRSMENVMAELRRMSLFRQLVPMEAGIGWPIPLRRDGRTYVTFPLFGFGRAGAEKPIELFAPFAAITLDWTTMRPVKYVSFAFERPWPATSGAVGTFPHEAIATMTTSGYKAARSELLAMYDTLMAALVSGNAPGDEFEARFAASLRTLLEPALAPYYRALGTKFFERFLPATA